MRLAIVVAPRASRDALAGWVGEALKIRVTAAPERGRANEAARAVLARALELPRDRVRLVAGHAGRRKVFEVDGLDEPEARRRIEVALASGGPER